MVNVGEALRVNVRAKEAVVVDESVAVAVLCAVGEIVIVSEEVGEDVGERVGDAVDEIDGVCVCENVGRGGGFTNR